MSKRLLAPHRDGHVRWLRVSKPTLRFSAPAHKNGGPVGELLLCRVDQT
jgi:hypothetical protein